MKHLIAGWVTVIAFLLFGDACCRSRTSTSCRSRPCCSSGMLGVILWCAFGVIVAADHLAEMLGEPYGTLILTFSIVAIEVMLISAVMLGGDAPTIGRDTMFAVMMIVLNGVDRPVARDRRPQAPHAGLQPARGERVPERDHPAGHDRADPARASRPPRTRRR